MNVGSKYRFWIHPDLAYGKDGTQTIEPNTLLIVEVELKAIKQAL
jgi:FKBP-type peptidyl-prolyl cis-trans isomerase FkpA